MSPSQVASASTVPNTIRSSSHRTQIVVLSLLAIAQALLVGLTGSGITRFTAVLFALVGLNARVRTLWILAALIVVNFCVHTWMLGTPVPMREAHLSLLLLYGAAALAAAVAFFATLEFSTTFAAAFALAVLTMVAEIVGPHVVPPVVMGAGPRWFDLARGGPGADDSHEPYGLLRSVYPDNPRGYFTPLGGDRQGAVAGPGVEYSLNALGCRADDYAIPNRHEHARVVLLGGSGAFGRGVHAADTVAARLQRAFSERRPGAGARPVDVINCGLNRSSTASQRAFFNQIASRYEPDAVVLLMGDYDNLSAADERAQGFTHEPGRLEDLSALVRILQWGRHEGRRPFDYAGAVEEVARLGDDVRSRGARFAVATFRTGPLDGRWADLVTAVSSRLKGTDTPFQDLGLALLKSHVPAELSVHPSDSSPNDVAHREAAVEIERLLRTPSFID